MNSNGVIVDIASFGSKEADDAQEEVSRDWYPFDPYTLPCSKKFVADYFLEYIPFEREDNDDMLTDSDSEGSEDIDDDDM